MGYTKFAPKRISNSLLQLFNLDSLKQVSFLSILKMCRYTLKFHTAFVVVVAWYKKRSSQAVKFTEKRFGCGGVPTTHNLVRKWLLGLHNKDYVQH